MYFLKIRAGAWCDNKVNGIKDFLRSEFFRISMIKTISNEKYVVGGHYSQGKIVGDLLFTCGHVAYNPETGSLINKTIKEETLQVLKNLDALARIAGTNLQKTVKINSYLTDMKYFKEYDEAFKEYFPKDPPPRTTVQIGPLLRDVHVEIDAIIFI